MWYTYVDDPSNFLAIPIDNVKKIISMNEQGNIPAKLEDFAIIEEKSKMDFSVEEIPLEMQDVDQKQNKKRKGRRKKK